METLFIYLLKSSGLIATYFLAYHFLLRKETFFTTNRWFLMAGMITSVVLPLFFIKRVIWIESNPTPLVTNSSFVLQNLTIPVENSGSIDWIQVLWMVYIMIVIFLSIKIVFNFISLVKLLRNQKIVKKEQYSLVDIQQDLPPFSFFNYIVFNSSLYTQNELKSILLHEKIHSQEMHSLDMLLAKLFSIVFWFNPFVWMYKKAIIQNLEYIADQKAIQHIEDKKVYQLALLKVVSNQNYLSITNHFYQSLIKKRIVMLNKNQSHKRNSWKYILIVPVLIAFVFLFQIKVEAQEKRHKTVEKQTRNVTELIWTKDATDEELERDIKTLEKQGIILKYSKLQRNKKGEIIAIKVEYKDNKGNKGVNQVKGDRPISTITFYKTDLGIGFGTPDNTVENEKSDYEYAYNNIDEVETPEPLEEMEPLEAIEMPEPPAPPAPPNAAKMQNMPAPPSPPNFPSISHIKTPTDPNDQKAWEEYAAKVEKFASAWDHGSEMKKFEAQMRAYEKKMEQYQPDMSAFENQMEEYQAKMENYREQILEKEQNKQEAMRDRLEARRQAMRDRMEAQREAMQDRKEAADEARQEAMQARKKAIEDRKQAIEAQKGSQ
jgi:hypothetical protein